VRAAWAFGGLAAAATIAVTLTLNFERLDLAADSGLTIFTYTAEPRSRHEQALKLLDSWTATLDQAEPTRAPDRT
jgi:hypothetical protein